MKSDDPMWLDFAWFETAHDTRKRLRRDGILISIKWEPEQAPVEDPVDGEEILRRVANGDVWAWAAVTVTAEIERLGVQGEDTLDCLSVEDFEDFAQDEGWLPGMIEMALGGLEAALDELPGDEAQLLAAGLRPPIHLPQLETSGLTRLCGSTRGTALSLGPFACHPDDATCGDCIRVHYKNSNR